MKSVSLGGLIRVREDSIFNERLSRNHKPYLTFILSYFLNLPSDSFPTLASSPYLTRCGWMLFSLQEQHSNCSKFWLLPRVPHIPHPNPPTKSPHPPIVCPGSGCFNRWSSTHERTQRVDSSGGWVFKVKCSQGWFFLGHLSLTFKWLWPNTGLLMSVVLF